MSVCVSVKVSEGLVLASDSASAIHGEVIENGQKRMGGVLKTYEHSRKLSHIKDYPIGTLTWGQALVGARSVESLIKEYEYSLPSLKEEQEKIDTLRRQGKAELDERPEYNVKTIAEGLLEHVTTYYNEEYSKKEGAEKPNIGILVSGYTSGEFFPEQWLIELPKNQQVSQVRPDTDKKPDFGANWYGLTDAIIRLHWGRDNEAIELLTKHFNLDEKEVRRVIDSLQYRVPFDGMPLQDAIDYAVYLINVAIGRFRFVIGAPLCGGEIDVAVVTPNTFTWVQRKSWKLKAPR